LVHAKARRREVQVVVHNAPQALFERRAAEVHDQPKGLSRQSKIGQKLLAMHGRKPLY
jgi:hypothetical protein